MLDLAVWCIILLCIIGHYEVRGEHSSVPSPFVHNPAPDGHRCGLCPTYHQKICAFNESDKKTYIFDNHCLMDLYNCLHGTDFNRVNYEECIFFGNFAYVHGVRQVDEDYGEDHVAVINANKNPDFV